MSTPSPGSSFNTLVLLLCCTRQCVASNGIRLGLGDLPARRIQVVDSSPCPSYHWCETILTSKAVERECLAWLGDNAELLLLLRAKELLMSSLGTYTSRYRLFLGDRGCCVCS